MNITTTQLISEAERALKAWPFIPAVEKEYGLPPRLLLAVGSRETNLTNETGDGGHGRGVWQLDDRSHTIPADFAGNVAEQARAAAGMLHGLIHDMGSVKAACSAYNAGEGGARNGIREHGDPDYFTTGRDYGADVIARMVVLQQHYGDTRPPPRVYPTLLPGATGPNVSRLQTLLHRAHTAWYPYAVDGVYGAHTTTGVRDAQHAHGLHVDGIAGPVTLRAIGF